MTDQQQTDKPSAQQIERQLDQMEAQCRELSIFVDDRLSRGLTVAETEEVRAKKETLLRQVKALREMVS